VARVSVDDAAAAEQAMAHLASLGHERIGLVLGPEGHVPVGPQARRVRPAHGGPRPNDQSWRELVAHVPFSMEGGSYGDVPAARPGA
jgi:DNA-binding LacI/PurR family transcriptional regulator